MPKRQLENLREVTVIFIPRSTLELGNSNRIPIAPKHFIDAPVKSKLFWRQLQTHRHYQTTFKADLPNEIGLAASVQPAYGLPAERAASIVHPRSVDPHRTTQKILRNHVLTHPLLRMGRRSGRRKAINKSAKNQSRSHINSFNGLQDRSPNGLIQTRV
jgi:hypothetical protein